MNVVLTISLAILVAAAVVTAVRAVRPGRLADRAVAFDTLTSVFTCGLLVSAAVTREIYLLEVALVLGLLGFLTSVAVGRFIERSGE